MKKFIKIATFATLVCSMFLIIISAYANEVFSVSVDDVTTKSGSEITVYVNIDENPGVTAFQLDVSYDSSVLKLKSAEKGDAVAAFKYTTLNSKKNPITIGAAADVQANSTPEKENITSTGVVAKIIFIVASDADEGSYPIDISIKGCKNYQKTTVDTSVDSAVIIIEEATTSTTVHAHNYVTSVTAPTCTEKGYTTYTCECGDTYKDNYVDATGHTPEVIPGKPATETETGLTDGEKCSVCGVITIEQNEIPATGHEHNYSSVVTAPTCTEKGYTTYTCECGDSYKDNYVDPTGSHADVDKNYKCDYCDSDLPRLPVTGGDDYNDDYSLGDVNDDGKITAADARTILRASARLETLTEIQSLAADIDGNGKLAASDARIALRISARLDSIDNYIKEEPPVDEPPVDEPPVDERTDLSEYIGLHVSDFTDDFPEFIFEDGVAAYDSVAISLDDSDCICDVTDTGSEGFSVFGVNGNTPYDEARAIFENVGFVFEDDETAFNSELGLYLWVFVGEDMTAYNVYFFTDDEVVFDNDLAMNLGCDIGLYLDNIPDLVEDEEDSSHFFTDYLDIFTDNGLVFDIIINGQCDYSIYGVAYGSTYEEAEENLAFYGFVYDEETDCWYNELYNEYVFVYYDENSLVDVVDVLVYSEQYPENELVQYLWCDIDDIENDFGELEFYPETEEYYAHYYIDGIYFYVDEFNIVTAIDIEDNEEYCILDIYTGSDLYYVTEMFALNEVYYACYDETFVIADDYLNGYTVFVSFDEGIVDYVSVYGSYYNLADYHMTEIESLLTVMPYLEKTDNLYQIPEFTFEVNEDGYVNSIILDSYNCCDINGIFVGMNGDDVSDVLEEYNFTYNFTDKDGYDFYYNTEEGLDMYVLVDENNEVICVCLY